MLPEVNQEFLKEWVAMAIETGDVPLLEQLVNDVCSAVFHDEPSPDHLGYSSDLFAFLVQSLRDPRLLALTGGSSLIMLFDYDFSLFTESQKTELSKVICEVIPRFSDERDSYLAVRLLVKNFGEYDALANIQHLRAQGHERLVSMIDWGIKRLQNEKLSSGTNAGDS